MPYTGLAMVPAWVFKSESEIFLEELKTVFNSKRFFIWADQKLFLLFQKFEFQINLGRNLQKYQSIE
jgi:hypothetical protein